jgi:hypothetical protein
MALNPKLSVARRNGALDNVLAFLNNGFLRIYDGTQPTDADTAIGAQVMLAELTFAATAFASASGGSASANAIGEDTNANASGTATWFRCFTSGGVAVFDGSVGTSAANLILNAVVIAAGARVSVTSMTVTMAVG